MGFQSTKTYGHDLGLSCAFRQWRAESHCNLLHGYAISVKLTFEAAILDERNWVVDFGGLKEVKDWLCQMFDHKTLIAVDDPNLEDFQQLERLGLIDLRTVEATGCEAFARMIGEWVAAWLANQQAPDKQRAWLVSVEVREHGANSAIYLLPVA